MKPIKGLSVVLLGLILQGHCAKVEVSNQAELIKALNDVSVDNIVLQNSKWPTWNFTEQQMPVNSSYIVGRDVVLEGAPGSLVYVDGNRLVYRVFVGNGRTFTQRNLWVDDCLVPVAPYSCFATVAGNGSRMVLQDSVMSDTSCVTLNESVLINAFVGQATNQPNPATVSIINSSAVNLDDTGWVTYFDPPGASWRFLNVTLTCTAGFTHPIPGSDDPRAAGAFGAFQASLAGTNTTDSTSDGGGGLTTAELVLAIVLPIVGVAALAVGVVWALKRRKSKKSAAQVDSIVPGVPVDPALSSMISQKSGGHFPEKEGYEPADEGMSHV